MTPAYELDTALIEFSDLLASKGLPTIVASNETLERIMAGVEEHLKALNLWQYYVLNAVTEKAAVKASVTAGKITPWNGVDVTGKSVVELAHIARNAGLIKGLGALAKRFGLTADPAVAAGFVQAAFVDLDGADALSEAWGRVVDVINVPLYEEWEADTKAALDGIKNRVKYTRLDDHGPKLGEISKTCAPYLARSGSSR